MRKWMQEKLKRRKKTPEEAAAQPAPLQPAYFNPQENPPEAAAARAMPKPDPVPETSQPASEAEAPATAPTGGFTAAPQSTGDARRPRRRRGRGGRGRKSPGQRPLVPMVGADASLAATPGPSAPPRLQGAPKGVVVLAVGLPGSGKSSWFKRHNITPLSSDMLRSLLFDDPAEQRFQDLVFSNLRSMLKARLIAHRPLNYVDATNLTPQERQNWIKLAKDFGYEVQAVFFDVPLEVCIERHQRRDRLVPEDVMRKMSAKLKAPTFEEGFSKIRVVRVKQQKPEEEV
jgi:predicted kinase